MSSIIAPGIKKAFHEHRDKGRNEHIHTISFIFTVFPHPLQCAQCVYKIGLSVGSSLLSFCIQFSLGASSQRESRNWTCECGKGIGWRIRSLVFYPSSATTELCDLGRSFIPPWALIYPPVEWELGVITKVLYFLYFYPSGTKCVDCPDSS